MNINRTVNHTGRENVEYYEDRRDYSKVVMFVVIPLVMVGVYFLLASM